MHASGRSTPTSGQKCPDAHDDAHVASIFHARMKRECPIARAQRGRRGRGADGSHVGGSGGHEGGLERDSYQRFEYVVDYLAISLPS